MPIRSKWWLFTFYLTNLRFDMTLRHPGRNLIGAGAVVALALIVLAVILVILQGNFFADSSDNTASSAAFSEFPPPADVQGLVDGADAIVVGKVGEIQYSGKEGPYGFALPTPDPSGRPIPGILPVTYYTIDIQDVLLSDDIVESKPVLRLIGKPEDRRFEFGEEFLFVLGRNPDNESYGIFGDFNALSINSDHVEDSAGAPVEFGPRDPEEFMDEVRAAIPGRALREDWPTLSSPERVSSS